MGTTLHDRLSLQSRMASADNIEQFYTHIPRKSRGKAPPNQVQGTLKDYTTTGHIKTRNTSQKTQNENNINYSRSS